MQPSGLTITPEPRLFSRRFLGIWRKKSSPKNWRKNGSVCRPRVSCLMTLEEEIFTTAGTTRLTTAEYPCARADSEYGATVTVGLLCGLSEAALSPRKPPVASSSDKVAVSRHGRL